MWEYYITQSDLWYKIFREHKEYWTREWRQWSTYTLNEWFAKTFYHMSDATSALVTARIQWKKTPTTSIKKSESEEEGEKKSWSEL